MHIEPRAPEIGNAAEELRLGDRIRSSIRNRCMSLGIESQETNVYECMNLRIFSISAIMSSQKYFY